MKSFSGLYIGLGLVFGLLFLGIVAELYYLLWWKKRINSSEVEDDDYSRHVKEPLHLISSKRPSFSAINDSQERTRDLSESGHGLDLELGCNKKKDEEEDDEEEEEEEEEDLELMRLYNLAGQPRFLFTIMEETKEDLESEDGKSRSERSRKGSRTRSLSDIIMAIDTPFFTPMASPPLKPSSPFNSLDSYKHHGFNPLFESSAEFELNRLRSSSSPPPKFKFLRDAEEKLYKRLLEEAQKRASQISGSVQSSEFKAMAAEERERGREREREREREGFVNANNEQRKPLNQRFHYSSSSSQVLPLVTSPPEFETLEKKLKGFC